MGGKNVPPPPVKRSVALRSDSVSPSWVMNPAIPLGEIVLTAVGLLATRLASTGRRKEEQPYTYHLRRGNAPTVVKGT